MKRILLLLFAFMGFRASGQDATEIIRKAEAKMHGESSQSEMEMKVVRPSWERTITFKTWSKGTTFSMVLILSPARDKGQSFLKSRNDMWSWNPTINRMIKMPPSMMSQGWMGSDYSNDDMMKESSLVTEFTHKILRKEQVNDMECWVIELIPTDESSVVWGKLVMWISTKDYFEMKSEFYDEDMELVKTHLAADICFMHDRNIPTRFEIIPAGKPTQKTIVQIKNIRFNLSLNESFFTQQNMKTLK